jgi:hypothetical protein
MKRRSSDEVVRSNWDNLDLPSAIARHPIELPSPEIEESIELPDIDHDSEISMTAQTLGSRLPDLSDADVRYLDRLLSIELSRRFVGEELEGKCYPPSNQSELEGKCYPPSNQPTELEGKCYPPSNQLPKVPVGWSEYRRVPKNGRDYFYYYWGYWAMNGSKRSIYLAATKQKAIAKIQRIGIPSDARVSDR